jgi:hypothetical protein
VENGVKQHIQSDKKDHTYDILSKNVNPRWPPPQYVYVKTICLLLLVSNRVKLKQNKLIKIQDGQHQYVFNLNRIQQLLSEIGYSLVYMHFWIVVPKHCLCIKNS